jgi:hypothetical protein
MRVHRSRFMSREQHASPIGRSPASDVEAGSRAADRFRELQSLHERARTRHPADTVESFVMFAGCPTRLRVVGRALAEILSSAFRHLAIEPDEPVLTIDLWDEDVVGDEADAEDDADLGRTWLAGSGLLTSVADGRLVRHQLPHTTVWLDREAQAIVGSVSSANDLSLYERGKPLHYLLSLWHNDRGTFVTHGALVARDDAGVLLAGAGGSGKSTTTAACSSAGFACVGDDCIGLERRPDGTFAGHGLFASIWLDDDALSRLPRFADGAVSGARPGEDKVLVDTRRTGTGRLARTAEIVAIGLPRVVDALETRARPATGADALRALAPSSLLLFAPSPGADGLRHLRALVTSVPAFWLDLGRDMTQLPRAIDALIAAARETRLTEGHARR